MATDMQTFHILGAGAIGCLWASRMSLASTQVTLVQRAVAKDNIQLTYRDEASARPGDSIACSHKLTQTTSKQAQGIENLLVCVKSHQLKDALLSIQHAVSNNTRVILMQNGMGNREVAASILPDCQLFMATTTQGAFIESRSTDGTQVTVVHAGLGITALGPAYNDQSLLNAPELCQTLQRALPDVYWHYHIDQLLWKKLAINAAINPLTAYYQCRNGELLDEGNRQSHLLRLIEEQLPVITHYCPHLAQYDLKNEILQVARATAKNYSSMYQDIASGRSTEIEAITGYLLKHARELTVELPSHLELYLALKSHSSK